MSEDTESKSLPGRFFSAVGGVAGKLFSGAEHAAGTTGRRAALAFAEVGQSGPDYSLQEMAQSLAGWFELKSRGETELSKERPSTVELNQARRDHFQVDFQEPGFLGKKFRFLFVEEAHPTTLAQAATKEKGLSATVVIAKSWPPTAFEEPPVSTFVWRSAANLGKKNRATDFTHMWLVDFIGFRFRHLKLVEKPGAPKSSSLFLGREGELKLWEELLDSPSEQAEVLSLTAQGGAGKSYFLKHLEDGYGPRILFARVDHQALKFEQDSVSGLVNILRELAAGLAKRGCATERFDKAYAGHLRQTQEDGNEPRGLGGAIRRTVQTMGSINPIVAAVGAGLDLVANWSQEVKEESEALASQAIVQTLTRALVEDLEEFVTYQRKNYLLWRRPVLAFDTYEILALVVDAWLRNDLMTRQAFHRLDPLLLVAGRHPLLQVNTRWSEYQEHLHHLHLAPFDGEQSRRYLERLKVPAERHDEFIELAQGYPLYLNLAAHSSSRGSAIRALATRVLEETREVDRHLFLVAASLEGFDRQTLARACGREELSEEDWNHLLGATFVESDGGRWTLVEPARSVLSSLLELEDPQRHRRLRE